MVHRHRQHIRRFGLHFVSSQNLLFEFPNSWRDYDPWNMKVARFKTWQITACCGILAVVNGLSRGGLQISWIQIITLPNPLKPCQKEVPYQIRWNPAKTKSRGPTDSQCAKRCETVRHTYYSEMYTIWWEVGNHSWNPAFTTDPQLLRLEKTYPASQETELKSQDI